MSNGVNKAIILGRLGADPEIRFTQTQKQVANLSIATSESWTDKNTGQKVEKTEWHRVIFFDRLAEIAGQYLKKGSQVYIEGRIHTRKWQNQQGVDQYTTEIVANELQMLGSGNQDQGQQQAYVQPRQYAQPAQQPQYQQQPQRQPQQQHQAPHANQHNANQAQQYAQNQQQIQQQGASMDDSIPF